MSMRVTRRRFACREIAGYFSLNAGLFLSHTVKSEARVSLK
jgi:hypothetical protein